MQAASVNASRSDLDLGIEDLGPLAWVLDELRKSLDGATKALKRFVRDADLARGSDLATLDASPLRIARQQLHQAVGALEMVGLPGPALLLRSMESIAQRFVQQPELCNEEAAARVERASFALTEYLEVVLAGKPVSPVALFPQYRDVQEVAKADRIHPADLWPMDWRWMDVAIPPGPSLAFDADARARLDTAVLQIMRGAEPALSAALAQECAALARACTIEHGKVFLALTAACFEAIGGGLLEVDLYVKRALPRILLQYASLARGEPALSDRLAHDLLFFCAQAKPGDASSPVLAAVRRAWGLDRFQPVAYLKASFGRFDPVVLAQARKRIAAAKETWTTLAGGDTQKFKSVSDQFGLVSDSISRLHPSSAEFAQALTHAIEGVVRSGQPPSTELGMEVATSILYLEAAFQDLDPNDPHLTERTASLAHRLERVASGARPEPLEPWMEDLYRRVSDRQTMGSVVGELKLSLGELEKSLDQFFRNPNDKTSLQRVPGQLAQMRGVLSVLGLDHATQAVARMRESVEEMLVTEIDEVRAREAGTFDQLGNNLGALGFLIDMLSYQPTLAKKLFVYDAQANELRPLMGRSVQVNKATELAPAAAPVAPSFTQTVTMEALVLAQKAGQQTDPDMGSKLDALATHATLDDNAALAQAARQASAALHTSGANPEAAHKALSDLAASASPQAVVPEADGRLADDGFEEDDLRGIFLEEANEVVSAGRAAIQVLHQSPADVSELTTLRRAFHTLKGSSRMVELPVFGEAAWSMEQVLNTWLADQKPADDALLAVCSQAFDGFSRWTADIASGHDQHWRADSFTATAEALRRHGTVLPIVLPDAATGQAERSPAEEVPSVPVATENIATHVDFSPPSEEFSFELPSDMPEIPVSHDASTAAPSLTPAPVAPSDGLPPLEVEGIDFEGLANLAGPVATPTAGGADAGPVEFLFDLDTIPAEAQAPLDTGAGALTPQEIDALFAPESLTQAETATEPQAAHAPMPETVPVAEQTHADEETAAVVDEPVKVIGPLRIGLPLYNVYLNEADEWSRRLLTELGEWALELHQPVPDTCIGFAHSLAGSSGTVGFTALSEMARTLEASLQHVQMVGGGSEERAALCVRAAEEIRHLLHQFAAGFLKEPPADLLAELKALQTIAPVSESGPVPLSELSPAAAPAHHQEPEPEPQTPPPVSVVPAAQSGGGVYPAIRPSVPQPAQANSTGDIDDDIDLVDAIDPDLFPIFDEEAAELMPQLGGALRQWVNRPADHGARSGVLRALHTLKGSARLAGAMRLGEMAHRMESSIEQLGSEDAPAERIEPLLQSFDGLESALERLRNPQAAADPAQAEPVNTPVQSVVASLEHAEVPKVQDMAPAAASQSAPLMPLRVMPAAGSMVVRPSVGQSVRVRSQLLDRLVNQAGEVVITRTRLEAELSQLRGSLADLTGNLDRLRAQLRDIELQAESQMQSRMAQAKDTDQGFDPLEFDRFTRVQELTRMMAESVNDVATVQRNLQRTVESTEDDLIAQARQTRELQRDLLRTRMVEFEGISERLYRVVRQASKDAGKQVKLDITGGSIEMDRGVLDRMTPAFEHLLRNCVAHGIEEPSRRLAAGKDASGLITIGLHQEGNDVSVEFRDDGAGLDLARIRDKAVAQGLVAPGHELGDAEAANLIFMPGFTTATQVTELSGRGIGMDVVRAEVNALGGRIETATHTGQGTSFRLVLPLTTAVTQVVMLRAGQLAIGAPANVVETVLRASAKDVQQAYNTGSFAYGDAQVPFFWAGSLLQASARSDEPQGKTIAVVIFRSAAQRVALHVDEVLGNQEVVVKNLGPQLARLPGLAGMSVMASGAVALIYNPVALATVYGDRARALSADKAQPHMLEGQVRTSVALPAAAHIPLVLVVDDSITVRRVTQRLLVREGYRVSLAADGLQALEKLQEERPTVVLSDIEMPRMDGFDLARNIRGDARLSNLPIIMITSRIAEKHREHASQLGVNHYLGKPYSEEELLSLVRHYCAEAAAAAVA